jgi:dimethylargininase
MRAIVRQPSEALSRCELTFLTRQPIDFARAMAQHRAYVAALEARGIAVQVLPPAADLPDAVFVEDTAVVLDECAIIARPGVDSRRLETDGVAAALARHRPLVPIEAPGTLEGGDVLRIGRTLLVAETLRTNSDGIRQLAGVAAPHGYEVVVVSLTGCLHLKSAITYAGMETVVLNPDWVGGVAGTERQPVKADRRGAGGPADLGNDLLARWQCIPVPAEEPYGANVLLAGDVVHVAASAPRTRRKLDALGFQTLTLETSEFEKAEAALTCLSLLFE